jgi:dephospho-CoA kinase
VVFENKLEQHFDYTISVSAPENIRLQRIIKRDGLTAEQFHARAEKQLPDEIKNGLSDFVIKNDGTQFLIPQVMKIHKYLITL